MLLPVFHLSVALLDSFTIWYDQMYVEVPFVEQLKNTYLPLKHRVLFLTMWCLTLQAIYFWVAFLNDVFGTNAPTPKKTPLLRKTKDILFTLAFPVAMYVSIAFWGIYAIDKELIFPEHIEKAYPVWLNHVMHTLIAIFIFIELLLSSRKYPTRKVGVIIAMGFNLSYILWLNVIYLYSGSWVYPVLDVMFWPLKVIFFSLSVFSGIFMYFVGEKLNSLVGSSPSKEINGTLKSH